MTPKTKTGTPGAETEPLVPGARHAVAPAGIVATGWPRVKATCRNIGWGFDPWQDATGRLILAKSEGGRWAADLSILSIPRQVGKSYLLGCIIFALCLLDPKLRVIWTSHHTATTEEMYEAMKDLASHKRVAPHVVKCIALQGSRWRIQFANGSRIDFGARSQGFGRGKAKVGVLVLDEFQHITARALANLAPTTNTSDNPLILCAGTPPGPEVSGEAFRQRRKAALEGISDDTLYVEFSADQGADPDDRRQWAKANPSFPKRTKERAFLLLKKILDPADYLREALGVWDDDGAQKLLMPDWPQRATSKPIKSIATLGVAISVDRAWGSIAACGSVGGKKVMGVVERRRGTSWLVGELQRIQNKHDADVMIAGIGPAGPLVAELEAAGVRHVVASQSDLCDAAAAVFDQIADGRVFHADHDDLNDAVKGAQQRAVGDGRWMWGRRASLSDVAMLEAASLALWGARESVYESRGVLTL